MVNLQDSKHPDVLKHLYYCVNFAIFSLNVWLHADKTRAVLPTRAAFKNCQGKHFITLFIFDASELRLGLKKHKLEPRLLGEISITSDMQMTPPLWQKVKRNSKAS